MAEIELPEGIQGLDEANAELDRLIAEQNGAGAGNGSANGAQRAGQPGEDDGQAGGKAADDASAAGSPGQKTQAGQQATQAGGRSEGKDQQQQQQGKAGQQAASESRYDRAVKRQKESWDKLNAEKEAFRAERETWQREKDTREREQREKSAGDYTPEQYDEAARLFDQQGRFEMADAARAQAKRLRENPEALKTQREAQERKAAEAAEATRKEWTLKAGQEFPDATKAGSPEQARASKILEEEPEMKSHPKGIYLAAKLASLELRSDRLSAVERELQQAKARVKELEGLTAPGDGGSGAAVQRAKSWDQMSDSEQFAQLEREASELGALR